MLFLFLCGQANPRFLSSTVISGRTTALLVFFCHHLQAVVLSPEERPVIHHVHETSRNFPKNKTKEGKFWTYNRSIMSVSTLQELSFFYRRRNTVWNGKTRESSCCPAPKGVFSLFWVALGNGRIHGLVHVLRAAAGPIEENVQR